MNKQEQDQVFIDRLLLLADFGDKIPEGRFRFNRFVSDDWDGNPLNLFDKCPTTACMLGSACSIPEFQKLGLRAFRNPPYRSSRVRVGIEILNEEEHPEEAASNFLFGTNKDEFEFLFMPHQQVCYDIYEGHEHNCPQHKIYGRSAPPADATAKQVAENIRFFVAHKYGYTRP